MAIHMNDKCKLSKVRKTEKNKIVVVLILMNDCRRDMGI